MSIEVYYQVMGDVVGPISPKELHRRIKEDVVTRDTLVRKGDDGEWMLADHVKGLFDETGISPPPRS